MIHLLRLRDRLRRSIGGDNGQLRKVLQAGLGLFDNSCPDVMTNAANLAGNVICGAGSGNLRNGR